MFPVVSDGDDLCGVMVAMATPTRHVNHQDRWKWKGALSEKQVQ